MRNLSGFSLAHFSLAFTGLLWTLPFLQPYHHFPMPMFRSEWLAFVLGLVALVLLATKRAWHDETLPAVALAPLGLAALVLLQAALGRVPYAAQAFTATLYLVWAALLIMLGAVLRRELGMATVVSVMAWCVVIGGELSAAVGVLQYYNISTLLDSLVMPRVSAAILGNLAQPNHYANYTALALASVAYLFASGRMRGAVAVAATALLLFALGLSGSRSAWLYIAAALAFALLLNRRHGGAQSRRLVVCAGLIVLGFAVDQWLMAQPWFAPVADNVNSATARLLAAEPGIDIKVQHARTAWWAFMHAPFLGVGWGQFPWHEFEFKALYEDKHALGVVTHTHNLITQLLAETGLVGALVITGGALLWLWDLRRHSFDLERWWLLALLATLGMHSMLEYPLWHSYFLGVAAIALGLGATRFCTFQLERLGPVAAALLLAAGFFTASTLWHSYQDFQRMFVLGAKPLPGEEIAAIVLRGQQDSVLEPYVELAASAYAKVDREQLQNKLELNGRVMRFMPTDIVVYRQALLLAMDGQAQAAQELFVRAMTVYPGTLPRITAMLRELTARYPAEFSSLLELAAKKSAQKHAAGESQ